MCVCLPKYWKQTIKEDALLGDGARGASKDSDLKDPSHQFADKFIGREPDALGTGLPQKPVDGFAIFRRLSRPNAIRLPKILETDSHSGVVLD